MINKKNQKIKEKLNKKNQKIKEKLEKEIKKDKEELKKIREKNKKSFKPKMNLKDRIMCSDTAMNISGYGIGLVASILAAGTVFKEWYKARNKY